MSLLSSLCISPRNTLFSHVPWLAVASAVERGQLPSSRGRDIEIVTLEECLKVKDDVTCPEAWLVGWRPHAAAIALRYSMTDEADVCVFFSPRRESGDSLLRPDCPRSLPRRQTSWLDGSLRTRRRALAAHGDKRRRHSGSRFAGEAGD